MPDSPLTFDLDGFDDDARAIIEHRQLLVQAFIRHVAQSIVESAVPAAGDEAALRRAFLDEEPAITPSAYLALAEQLRFLDTNNEIRLRRLRQSGFLGRSRERQSERAQQLVADRVVHLLEQVSESACKQARDVVLAWCTFGQLGLLKHSAYPYFNELLMLQRHVTDLEDTEKAQISLAVLRADLIALCRTLHAPEVLELFRARHGPKARLWDQSLLHQSPNNRMRERYKERLAPDIDDVVVEQLAYQRGCSREDATRLFEALLHTGLSGLIAWRIGTDQEGIHQASDRLRVQTALVYLLRPLPVDIRQLITTRLEHLQDAMIATRAPFSLFPLIRDLPGSKRRRKRQRYSISKELIESFAERAHLSAREARSAVQNVMIYGPLGALPQRMWRQAFHPHVWSYLHMFKLGRLEDTIDHTRLVDRVNAYAQQLGQQPLPRQMVVGVVNHFRKPDTYNSGDGDAIAGVPLRNALKLAGVARLHERWLIVAIELDIQFIDALLHSIDGTCHVILVIDCGCQCPLGCWVSSRPPDSVEVGLALYQSIFHPGALQWPLRGLPETIAVPQDLTQNGLADLQRAATCMMAEVEVMKDPEAQLDALPRAKRMIADLKMMYKPGLLPGRRRAPKQRMTVRQLQDTLLAWLYSSCFTEHRSDPVIYSSRQHGLALPGFDTPAAGWLLPVTGTVRTIQDGVHDGPFRYTSPVFSSHPGEELAKREFPYLYEGMKPFIFVGDTAGETLHYLTNRPS